MNFKSNARAVRESGYPATKILHLLNVIARDRVYEAHEATQRRLALHRQIAECSENGKIALVRGGRDCDGVQYSGYVSLVDADWRKVLERIDHDLDWADGPMSHSIEKPSVAAGIEYQSQDLVAEAYENGHPHCIYTSDF